MVGATGDGAGEEGRRIGVRVEVEVLERDADADGGGGTTVQAQNDVGGSIGRRKGLVVALEAPDVSIGVPFFSFSSFFVFCVFPPTFQGKVSVFLSLVFLVPAHCWARSQLFAEEHFIWVFSVEYPILVLVLEATHALEGVSGFWFLVSSLPAVE